MFDFIWNIFKSEDPNSHRKRFLRTAIIRQRFLTQKKPQFKYNPPSVILN